jgi:hypothetical protein
MATPKKKETDYRSSSALLKKQLAARSGKSVVLPSRKNVTNAVKQIGGAALTIAGPGKVVKGVQAASKIANARKVATATGRARSNSAAASKMVAQKASLAKRQQLIAAQDKLSPKEMVRTNSAFQARIKSVLPERVLQGRSVKQVSPTVLRGVKNRTANVTGRLRKSGEAAKRSAADVNTGVPNATVKIKSGGDIKPASSLKGRLASFTPNQNRQPNLIKIDSAKGNSVKKTAYRPNKRTSN